MTMPLARELSVHGIRVVAVAPGAFDTPIYEQVPPAVKESLVQTTLHPKRLGRPEEFALFVEELIRNPAHNGRVYRLDGGAILPPGL
jgi:NAD(P)-dependent dehydrogenase (short-subunit alcohol dehydrogenase family)